MLPQITQILRRSRIEVARPEVPEEPVLLNDDGYGYVDLHTHAVVNGVVSSKSYEPLIDTYISWNFVTEYGKWYLFPYVLSALADPRCPELHTEAFIYQYEGWHADYLPQFVNRLTVEEREEMCRLLYRYYEALLDRGDSIWGMYETMQIWGCE